MMPDTMPNPAPTIQKLVLLTGPAGSGRSTALRAFEDLGFEVIDNIPFSLVPRLIQGPLPRPLALGLDPRNRDFSVDSLLELANALRASDAVDFELAYLGCGPDTLVRRFSETRRNHPLLPDRPVRDGIALEARLLAPISGCADVVIATDDMTPHDLRAEIQRLFHRPERAMQVQVLSFSYRRGLPIDADLVLDCRFLRNPHWDRDLRPKDGRDTDVQAHIDADPRAAPFFASIETLLRDLLPAFDQEGRAQLTIAFGCTGGKHRSVAFAERLAKALAPLPWPVSIRHREIEHATPASGPAQLDKVRT